MKTMMLIRFKRSVGGFLVSLTAALSATGAVIRVPADHATIQAAVNGAAAGDEIHIAAGVYAEQAVVTRKNLSLTGEPGTVIKAWPGMVQSTHIPANVLFEFVASEVTVSGIDFEGDRQADEQPKFGGLVALLYYGASGRVENCVIRGVRGATSLNGTGLASLNPMTINPQVVNLAVSHNTFADNGDGMWVAGDFLDHPNLLRTTVAIEDNTITGVGPTSLGQQRGISIEPSVGGTITNNRITDHYFTASDRTTWAWGIQADDDNRFGWTNIFAMQPLRFENNVFLNNQNGIGSAKCDTCQFMNNFFQGTNGTLTTAGLVLSGTDLGISFNQFTNLSRGIVLLGDDPDLGTNAGPAINATVMRNRFCDVATNVVVEPLVTGTAESGSLTCPWPPPSLTIAPAVMLSWPDYAIGWTLEAATNLQGPWTQVAMVPSLVGGDYVLALKTDTQKGFFRLRAP